MVLTSGGQDGRNVQTCSLEKQLPQEWHVVATEACTVSKWVVHILLVCFLVTTCKKVVGVSWNGRISVWVALLVLYLFQFQFKFVWFLDSYAKLQPVCRQISQNSPQVGQIKEPDNFYGTENSFCTIDNWKGYLNWKLSQTDIYFNFTHSCGKAMFSWATVHRGEGVGNIKCITGWVTW